MAESDLDITQRDLGHRISLTELVDLRLLQMTRRRKSSQLKHRRQRLETSCEVRNRILGNVRHLQHGLSGCIQSGDTKNFALLYHTFQALKQACHEWDAQDSNIDGTGHCPPAQPAATPFDRISVEAQASLLDFLSRIAFDPDYLLSRLMSLSSPEFASLLKPCSQGLDGDIAFGRAAERPPDGWDQELVEGFLDFSRRNPLEFLLRFIPRNGFGHKGPYTSIWGHVCAGLLSHQTPGSDKFVVAILNGHVGQLRKTAVYHIENWLLETLQAGGSLMNYSEPITKHRDHRVPSNNENAINDFFSTAIRRLLWILKNNQLTNFLPKAVLCLSSTIVDLLKHSPRQQSAAPYFLCTRWLFSSYLSSLIKRPEKFGLLLSYHISLAARQQILGEMARRIQQLAENVTYSRERSSHIDDDCVLDMASIVDLFHAHQPACEHVAERESLPQASLEMRTAKVTVCITEVLNAFRGLYPEHFTHLSQGTQAFECSTLRSSASSVSGLSLFGTGSPRKTAVYSDSRATSLPQIESTGSSLFAGVDPPRPDLNTSLPAGTAEIVGLREACAELYLISGHDPFSESCDLFSEDWISLTLLQDEKKVYTDGFKEPPCNKTTNVDYCAENTSSTQASDQDNHNLLQDAVLTLVDLLKSQMIDLGPSLKDTDVLHTSLVDQFEHARASCYHQGDFSNAHFFYRAAKKAALLSSGLSMQLIGSVAQSLRSSLKYSELLIQRSELKMEQLTETIAVAETKLDNISHVADRLREKMWYISDVQSAAQYEGLSRVVSSLRTMTSTVSSVTEIRQPSLRHRNASRSLNQDIQSEAETATFKLLSVPQERGGPNKLSDIQVGITLHWMQMHGVEKICRAEERIHRFCSELSRCLDSVLSQNVSENSTLWSGDLFRDQIPGMNGKSKTPIVRNIALDQMRSLYASDGHVHDQGVLRIYHNRSPIMHRNLWCASFTSRSLSSKLNVSDHVGCRSPTLTHRSSSTLPSTFSADPQSPSSATSLPSRALSPTMDEQTLPCVQQNQTSFLEELKQHITSLLLSDFTQLFREGSETDLSLRNILCEHSPIDGGHLDTTIHEGTDDASGFNFDLIFRTLLKQFELQASPYAKLDILLELHSMLQAHQTEVSKEPDICGLHDSMQPDANVLLQDKLGVMIEETSSTTRNPSSHDSTVSGFRRLFHDVTLRPRTLFRDLQYIAALVPLPLLDSTPRGRAFWNATVAALDLKQEICQTMIETADQIVQYHTFHRGHSRVTSPAQAKRDAAAFADYHLSNEPPRISPSIANMSMSDAAMLLQSTAKEGIPAAQRELATLYLTHPELLGVCLAPFTRPSDVFKDAVTGKKEKEKVDRDRYDPIAMAVAQHWMELSAKGGDGPAARYLKAKDEFEKIP